MPEDEEYKIQYEILKKMNTKLRDFSKEKQEEKEEEER